MKRPVFAANWKMNFGPQEATRFLRTFLEIFDQHADRTVAFFPPALLLGTVVEALASRPDLAVGAQNVFWEDHGAFTGENSPATAAAMGARFALVGHSERRHLFGERDEEAGRKCAAACRAGLIPLLCVGETIEERHRGETKAVVLRQLRAGLGELEPEQIAEMAVAYEPVWAIGTGHTASPHDATTVHDLLRQGLAHRVGERAARVPILYGGSVNVTNARSLLDATHVDGLLVGGASLDPVAWAAIADT